MARTPLLSAIRALVVEHRIARKLGLPVEAVRERRERAAEEAQRRGVTRRQFLAGAGAAGALACLPKRGRASGGPKIAIVGGGIAGLTCALELQDRGLASTVYEASGRLGGRMFSNTSYWDAGQVSEWGGEFIDSGHHTIRNLAARFGLSLDNLLKAQPNKSEDVYHFFGGYYPKSQADADFSAILDAVVADEAAAPFPTTWDAYTAHGQMLDHINIVEYIDRRVPGGHSAPLGALLDVAYAIEYGADAAQQSALNLLYLLAYQPNPNELALFGESDEKFHIRGGNQQLPEAIAAALPPDSVETSHKLVRIKETAGGRYRLWFERASGTVEVVADWVVLAVPFAVLAGVDTDYAGFDPLKRQAIQQQGRGHNGRLQLQFGERGWLGQGPWPGKANGSSYSDTGYQSSWDVTRAQDGTPGILVLYSGGSVTDAMHTNQAFATAANTKVRQDAENGLVQLAPVFPGLSWNGKATQSLPHKSPYFKASYSFYRPGQYTAFAGYESVRQGGILFAGEHTSTDFQGFMEGGAEQGQKAGKQLSKLV